MLLGYGVQLLQEVPVLGRDEIEGRLPAALKGSHLGRQVEQIKVTPDPMSTDELSRLWSALNTHYRPSVPYRATVVLIEPPASGRVPVPVLERRITVVPELELALPGITAAAAPWPAGRGAWRHGRRRGTWAGRDEPRRRA